MKSHACSVMTNQKENVTPDVCSYKKIPILFHMNQTK